MTAAVAPQTPARADTTAAGIGIFLCALVLFAGYDAFAKQMVATYPPTVVNLARYIAVSAVALVLLVRHGDVRVWRQPHQKLLALRSGALAIVATCFMTALVTMPLAEATAIYFTAPLIMVALSPWLLGERVGRAQWTAVLLGFAGMLCIVRPGGSLPLVGTLLMAVSAVCYALFQVLTRRLSGLVIGPAQYAHMALVCLVVTSLPALFQPHAALPPWPDMALLIAGGAISAGAQLLLLAAFRRAGAATLGPLNYVQLLLAVAISTLWFQRPPDALALAGMALIAVAGVYLARARRPA
jgi:drug/metabolite transporter (DMT)-like permease